MLAVVVVVGVVVVEVVEVAVDDFSKEEVSLKETLDWEVVSAIGDELWSFEAEYNSEVDSATADIPFSAVSECVVASCF